MQHTSAVLYGKGIFTTVAIHSGRPLLFEKHWRRLADNAAAIGIDLSEYPKAAVAKRLDQSIGQNGVLHGRARITFFDERMSDLWPSETAVPDKTTISILLGEMRRVPGSFKLSVSPFPVNSRSPLAGVKSCSYLEQIIAMDDAKGRGFDEAVRVNERGAVTSGCMSNIFWLKGDRLFTPALSTGCLAGTTREFVLENLDCEEVEAELGALESADAIYMTSAGLGVVRVAEFNGRELADPQHAIKSLWPLQK